MTRHRLKIFFDGGCRPNPGRMEAAVVLRGAVHLFDDLGPGTSRDAEWLALIRALELGQAEGLGARGAGIELMGDSRGVIEEAQQALLWVRDGAGLGAQPSDAPPFQGHAARFVALATKGVPLRIRWIKRTQNLAGIALAARHPR